MSILRLQVTLPCVSALAEDAVVNTWHFGTAPDAPDEVQISHDIIDAVSAAVSQVSTLSNTALGHFFSQHYIPYEANARMYRLNDAKPRAPLVDRLINYGNGGAGALPGEVALCGSFQAAKASGEAQARKRNRIYFGPFNTSAINNTGGAATPQDALINAIRGTFVALATASAASAAWSWVVYSGTTVPPRTWPVANGWCDNAWDTQRRRGRKHTTRSTVVLAA